MRVPYASPYGMGMEMLEPRQLLTGQPVITEFMASNDGSLDDGDGKSPDWIEIQNIGDTAMDLAGYRLTDDPSNLARWVFPSVQIDPGEYLVVFASAPGVDNYVDAGGNLHTNFALSASGEYLALVGPDGTVHSEYGTTDKEYPEQTPNVSYGVAQQEVVLDGQSDVTYMQPLSGDVDSIWTQIDFDALAHDFTPGQAALGYETDPDSRNSFSGEILTELTPDTHAIYARVEFDLENASHVSRLNLGMKYDNGFIAYLNGVPVASANAPEVAAWFSSAPTRTRDSLALEFEHFDLTEHTSLLVDGTNVLAIHGLNNFTDRDDMLIVPQLVATVNRPDARVGYMTTPTPGAENVGSESLFSGFLGETQIDVAAGFYDEPFAVTISTVAADAEIRYTTDGSTPSATRGTIYTGPIQIETTTTLRAAAFQEGIIPTDVETHSYLFLEDVIRQSNDQPGLPTRWEQPAYRYDADYEMDPDIVNDPAYRDEIVDGLRSIPTMSIVMDPEDFLAPDGIYIQTNRHGIESERAISLEIINPDGSLGVQVDAGLRNHGNRTRDFDVTLKQSLRLVFRTRYDTAKLEYPLFPESPVDRFDNIVLHATKILDDPQLIRNSFGRDTNLAMGHLGSHSTHVNLYLNGLYWGIYNPFERADAKFAEEYMGGDASDYDAILSNTEVIDGDVRRFNQMWGMIRDGITTPQAYEELQRWVDLDSLFDLLLINQYMAHGEQESRAIGRREGDANFQFFAQDLDEAGMDRVRLRTDIADFLPAGVFNAIRDNPDLSLRYADRAQKHLLGDGELTPEAAQERWEGLYQNIFSAVIAESARWGDTHWRTVFPRQPFTRDGRLANDGRFLREEFFPQRSQIIIDQLRSMDIYPEIDAPSWNQWGGAVSADFQLIMTNPNGSGNVLYTLDGTDPRQFGGNPAAEALIHDGSPIPIEGDTVVKARIFSDGQWSALVEGDFFVVGPDSPFHLRVTEINYHPHEANPTAGLGEANVENSQFEFVELTNTSTETIDMGGVQLVRGVSYTFPAGISLAAGERTLVVTNQEAFQSRYGTGLNIAGEFAEGTLPDAKALLALDDANGRRIQTISYSTQDPWPQRANGRGSSLEIIDPLAASNEPTNWRSSSDFGGSPGGGMDADQPVAITEVLAHSPSSTGDMIELHNLAGAPVEIGNWYVSNSDEDYFNYQIPAGTTIVGGGYHVLAGTDFGFDLNSSQGDELWLMEADANGKPLRFVDHVQFGPSGEAVSMGPGPAPDGRWYPLASQTFGGENSGLRVGDVIISEVHYAPLDPDGDRRLLHADDFEFVELHNRTDNVVDLSGWRLDGDIELTLPAGTTIDARQSLLAVPFDPADRRKAPIFRVLHDVDPAVVLMGPYSDALADDGAVVRLEQPDQPPADDPNFTPYLYVDEVAYLATAPWPTGTVNTGSSLTRVSAESYGNFAASWTARAASPDSVDFTLRLAGDANEDGRFDQLDLVHVLQGGRYQTGQPATWSQGDWNGDGRFDPLDLVTALQTGAYLGSVAAIGSGHGVKSVQSLADANLAALDSLFERIGDLAF